MNNKIKKIVINKLLKLLCKKKGRKGSENNGIKTNSMELGRMINVKEHLRKTNKCGTQQRSRIGGIYTQKHIKTNWLL